MKGREFPRPCSIRDVKTGKSLPLLLWLNVCVSQETKSQRQRIASPVCQIERGLSQCKSRRAHRVKSNATIERGPAESENELGAHQRWGSRPWRRGRRPRGAGRGGTPGSARRAQETRTPPVENKVAFDFTNPNTIALCFCEPQLADFPTDQARCET